MSTHVPGTVVASEANFTRTHWSIVLAAGDGNSRQGAAALEQLCRTYWLPLYAFIRRRGYPPHDAQDLTQEFFARLLAGKYLNGVDPRKGRFRSFLLASLENFLANNWRRANALKRGGGITISSLDDDSAERQYQHVPASNLSPEQVFDRQWALALLERTVGCLRDEFTAAGKGLVFDELKVFLTGEKRNGAYAELASKLKTTEAALKMAVSRMRQRYGELLRGEIANTVTGPEEIEGELRALFAAVS